MSMFHHLDTAQIYLSIFSAIKPPDMEALTRETSVSLCWGEQFPNEYRGVETILFLTWEEDGTPSLQNVGAFEEKYGKGTLKRLFKKAKQS